MNKTVFIGARMEKAVIDLVDKTAEEEHVDRTKALKELLIRGRKDYLLEKYMDLYRDGKCSIGFVAENTGITIYEAMEEAAKRGLGSDETIEEYKQGLKALAEMP